MVSSLFINRLPGCRRLAIFRDERLLRYQLLKEDLESEPGDLIVGRVTKVTATISAAFVDMGAGTNGFLDTKDAPLFVVDNGSPLPVAVPKEGQALLVQLNKPALRDKLATLSGEVKLVGFHCILFPLGSGLRFSKDFNGDKPLLRERFAAINQQIGAEPGWLVRSSAAAIDESWVKADATALWSSWQVAMDGLSSGKSRNILKDDPLMRVIREGHKEGWRSIICDDHDDFQNLRSQFLARDPSLLPSLKYHDADSPLFDTYRVEDEIAKLEESRVWLKSGGTLDISQTEAMVTIDVNTARNTKERKEASAGLRTNLEAAKEIGRQIRARNLAGLLVIDFVSAKDSGWRQKVDQALRGALAGDDSRTDILPINKFGVAMIARQRSAQDVGHSVSEPCKRCNGRGWVKHCAALALDIQKQLRRQAPGLEGEKLEVFAGADLAKHLKEHHATLFAPLAQQYEVEIIITQDTMGGRNYRIDIG